MRDIEKRALETHKYNQQKEKREIEDYINWDEEYKQKVWTSYMWQLLQQHRWLSSTHEPELIKFSDLRNDNKYWESNIDKYLPWILKDLEDFYWDDWNPLETIFTFDEKAKKVLEIWISINDNSEQVINTIDSEKTDKIEWLNIDNKELAEKIWDLFYDSLSSFITSLWKSIDKKEVSELLEKASKHIFTAWEICLPYVSHDFPEMKHTTEIKGIDIEKTELANKLWNLENDILSDFLEKLWDKIQKDWEADKWRWRIKLANELFSCAENLKTASKI